MRTGKVLSFTALAYCDSSTWHDPRLTMFCHVRWREQVLRGWLLGLTNRAPKPFRILLHDRTAEAVLPRSKAETMPRGKVLQGIFKVHFALVGYYFHSGSSAWLLQSSALLCSAEDLQILTAPGFHLPPRHREPLQPTAQVKSSFEEQFSFYI